MSMELILIIAAGFALFLFLWLYIFLPASMAKSRGRSVVGWILFFWFVSPFWGVIALLIIGDSQRKIQEDILKRVREVQKQE